MKRRYDDTAISEITLKVQPTDSNYETSLSFPFGQQDLTAVLQRIGMDTDLSFKILEVDCRLPFLNEIISNNAFLGVSTKTLCEINFLAGRMSRMSDYERLAFEGMSRIHHAETLLELINVSYNLDNADLQGGISSLAALGEDAIHGVKDRLPTCLHEYLDKEAAGRQMQELTKGVFVDGVYVADFDRNEFAYMYNGEDFPDINEFGTHFFRLMIASASAYEQLGDKAPTVTLKLPENGHADDAKWLVRHKLDVSSLDSCVVLKSECIEPRLAGLLEDAMPNEVYDFAIDLLTVNGNEDHLPLFFAALEYLHDDEKITLKQAKDILDRSFDFELFYHVRSSEDYARILLHKQLPAEMFQATLPIFDFKRYGEDMMRRQNAVMTSEGILIPPDDLEQTEDPAPDITM